MEIESNSNQNQGSKTVDKPIISTFVPRVFALIIDLIILGLIGYTIGVFFRESFVKTGIHGLLIGWLIATIYYTLGNSKFTSGRTLGKFILLIKVTNTKGESLSIREALVRALFFTTPYFLFDYFQGLSTNQYLSSSLGFISFSYYFGLAYFYLANRNSRQTIHDIFSKTLVITKEQDISVVPLNISKAKYGIFVGLIVLLIGSYTIFSMNFTQFSNTSEIFEANQKVLNEIIVEASEINEILYIESATINIDSEVGIIVTAKMSQNFKQVNMDEIGSKILDVLKTKEFNISRLDYSEVILNYGFDIGISKYSTSQTKRYE